jgi:hypothetical protein
MYEYKTLLPMLQGSSFFSSVHSSLFFSYFDGSTSRLVLCFILFLLGGFACGRLRQSLLIHKENTFTFIKDAGIKSLAYCF